MNRTFFCQYSERVSIMHMRIQKGTVLISSISIIAGVFGYLILSGTLIQGFNPLASVVETASYGSFSYLTNMLPYETSEVSYNMDEMYNTTHLYDFSSKKHFGERTSTLRFDIGVYGRSLQWPGGQVVGEDLDIVRMSFTLEAWIYPTSEDFLALAGSEAIFPVIYKATNGSMLYQYSGGLASFYSNQSVNLNAWTHVALVYDAVSGVAKWYLNASEQGSKEVGARVWDGEWSIGQVRPGIPTFEWKGKIDEFRIYKGRALRQSEIQEDMKTSIGHKLTLTGLIPNVDIVQLSYPDGEFARIHMLQQTADANGQVEFSVYSFSGRSQSYIGVLKVLRSGRTYVSPVTEFSWEDFYHFSTHTSLTETVIAALAAGLIMVVPSVLMVLYRYKRKHHEPS